MQSRINRNLMIGFAVLDFLAALRLARFSSFGIILLHVFMGYTIQKKINEVEKQIHDAAL